MNLPLRFCCCCCCCAQLCLAHCIFISVYILSIVCFITWDAMNIITYATLWLIHVLCIRMYHIYISTCEEAQDRKVGPMCYLNLMFFYLILFRDAHVWNVSDLFFLCENIKSPSKNRKPVEEWNFLSCLKGCVFLCKCSKAQKLAMTAKLTHLKSLAGSNRQSNGLVTL